LQKLEYNEFKWKDQFGYRSMKNWFEKFVRRSFLEKFDDYRCVEYYQQLLEECKIDKRTENLKEIIEYVRNKYQKFQKYSIQNIHYISIHENEEMNYPRNLERYWLSI
jgi:hypothetical protein